MPLASSNGATRTVTTSLGLTLHLLRFRGVVTAPLQLPLAAGAALRGALFNALRSQCCLAGRGPGCGTPALAQSCPVCFLLAPISPDDPRGRDIPRPYVLEPPDGASIAIPEGGVLELRLLTVGRALSHFPYALLGIQDMGQSGMGVRREGTFRLEEVWAEHPIRGLQERSYRAGEGVVRSPNLPITTEDVQTVVERLRQVDGSERLSLRFRSPVRLIAEQRLVKPEQLTARILLGRALERLDALDRHYGNGTGVTDAAGLLRAAEAVRISSHALRWQELARASGRHRRMVPMGGLVGELTLEGPLESLLPYFVWASLLHVGKDAAMGNGRIDIVGA